MIRQQLTYEYLKELLINHLNKQKEVKNKRKNRYSLAIYSEYKRSSTSLDHSDASFNTINSRCGMNGNEVKMNNKFSTPIKLFKIQHYKNNKRYSLVSKNDNQKASINKKTITNLEPKSLYGYLSEKKGMGAFVNKVI